MIAVQYARWSSIEQSTGSTLARQIERTGEFVAERGWTLTSDSPLIDRGKSAYTGANIETGELGKFGESIMRGQRDPIGLVLVVEELDRLSRQPADVMLSWLSPLVRRGLTIAVVNTGQMITRQMLDMDMGGLMTILITAFGSHSESRKKAVRVAAAWNVKRENARNGEAVQRNHRRPKWVEIGDDGEWYVPPVKLEIVKLIFSNRIAGIGKGMTAQKLNELWKTNPAFAPWPLDAGNRKAPAMWSATYVGRVLRNRAVMGEWQPYTRPRKGEPTPAGEPIADYYPRIIDPATFARANEERIKDALKHQGRGRGLSNLLGTRARCGTCGGQMSALGSAAYFVNKRGEKRRHYFLYCTASKVAKTCDNARGWTYDRVEGPLLDAILQHAMDDQHFASDNGETAAMEGAVYAAKAAVREIEGKLTNLLDMVEAGNKAAIRRYQQREVELEQAKIVLGKAENDLAGARGKVSPAEHLRRVSEVRGMMWDDDPDIRYQARLKVKQALADIIESIKFFPETGNVAVMLVDRMRRIGINHAGEIIDDIDLGKVDDTVGPGYGRVRIVEDGKTRYENDLNEDQIAGSKAYVRRRAVE